MSKDSRALIVEGFRPGVRFRTGPESWSNGSACPNVVAEKLCAQGYQLRPALPDEVVIDDPNATRITPWPAAPGVPVLANGA